MVQDLYKSWYLQSRSTEEKDALKGFAVVCAAQGRTESLRRMMVQCLVQNEPQEAIQLYESFVASNAQHLSEPDNLGTILGEEFELEDDTTVHQYKLREAELLVAVIAAYAIQDSFEGALHTVLKHSRLRFGPRNVNQLFEGTLLLNSSLHRKTVDFMEAIAPARLVKEVPSLRRHVRILVSEKNLEGLKALSASMFAGYNGKYPWAAMSERDISHSRPLVIPEEAWAILLSALMRCGREDLAEGLWAKLSQLGLELGATTWNGLLEGFRARGDMDRLAQTWGLMRKKGIQYNSHSYGIKIAASFSKGRTGDALADFNEFKKSEELQRPGNDRDRLTVYNTVLHGLLSKKDPVEGMSLYQSMLANGPAPDVVTYNTIMAYYGKRKDIRNVAGIIGQMQAANIRPDIVSFTTVLSSLLRANVVDATDRLLSIMRKCGIEENIATYSALIDHQVREGTARGISAAFDLLSRMENTSNARPNEITYTSILLGVHRCKELDRDTVNSMTKSIIQKLLDRRMTIKRGTCQVILKAFIDNPSPEGLSSAIDFYQFALKRNVQFGRSTWITLLHGLTKRNEWDAAHGVVQDMLKLGVVPTSGLGGLVERVLRHYS
jgi:pentatricopeptide repeat protein